MENIKIDKSFFSIVSSFDECEKDDKNYWHSKTPLERLEAMELKFCVNYLRQKNIGILANNAL